MLTVSLKTQETQHAQGCVRRAACADAWDKDAGRVLRVVVH